MKPGNQVSTGTSRGQPEELPLGFDACKLAQPIQRNPRGLRLAQGRKAPVMEAGTRIEFEPIRHSPMDHGRSALGKGQNNVTGKGDQAVCL